MPRITIHVIAPNTDYDQRILSFPDLSLDLSLADLKGFVNAETNIPLESQQFFLNNQLVQGNDSQTLSALGVKGDDMIAMLIRQPGQQNNTNTNMGSQRTQQRSQQRSLRDQGEQEIETLRQNMLNNPANLQQLREQRPALADAINDRERFRGALMQMEREAEDLRTARLEEMRKLNESFWDPESQKKIEEMIRQESVQENLQFAYEYNPEVFARVTMLYVPVQVNKHPIKAFVDSGAQTTIMSPSCAEACGIMRLIDRRYSGVAKGVGTAQILGRVHSAPIKIGNETMPCSFTVMEGKDVDLLLGLDMLKRFQAVIDLRQGKLVMGDANAVAFLGEADIPKQFEDAMESEPTVKGPNGTEIGAESGSVKPAGTSAAASSSTANGNFGGQGRALGTQSDPKAPASSTPATAAPTPATAGGAPTRQTPQQSHPKAKIDQLVSMGFSEDEAIAALNACDGDVDYAVGLLL